jgi:hypothetical protein
MNFNKTLVLSLIFCISVYALADQTYTIVETGQTKCYDNHNEISPPKPGQPFYGQDAQFQGHPFSYAISTDGLTIYDRNTGLTWQTFYISD